MRSQRDWALLIIILKLSILVMINMLKVYSDPSKANQAIHISNVLKLYKHYDIHNGVYINRHLFLVTKQPLHTKE